MYLYCFLYIDSLIADFLYFHSVGKFCFEEKSSAASCSHMRSPSHMEWPAHMFCLCGYTLKEVQYWLCQFFPLCTKSVVTIIMMQEVLREHIFFFLKLLVPTDCDWHWYWVRAFLLVWMLSLFFSLSLSLFLSFFVYKEKKLNDVCVCVSVSVFAWLNLQQQLFWWGVEGGSIFPILVE